MRKATDLEKILSTDPISEFEQISGKEYKQNSAFENLAMMGFHLRHNQEKERLLFQSNDTTFSMSMDDYEQNIEDYGFVQIYGEQFTWNKYGETASDWLKVFWYSEFGLLLHFDTYRGDRNGGKVHYNWMPNENFDYGVTSSGSYGSGEKPYVWVGDHDCREVLRFYMNQLKDNGTLLPQWKFRPSSLWITHHGETDEIYGNDGHDWSKPHLSDIRTAERIRKFPVEVQKAILFEG